MAAIDKIHVDSFEKYKLFKDWCLAQPKIKDKYGKETSLINYVFERDADWKEGVSLPICSNPYYLDAYLIKNCPFDFIQKELMLNYGKWSQDMIDEAYDVVIKRGGNKTDSGIYHWLSKEDFSIVDGKIYLDQGETDYDLIKSGKLFSTPYIDENYNVGKSFRVVKRPKQRYNRPFKCKRWFIHVDTPEGLGYLWYHGNTNTWDFTGEFVISYSTSNCCTKYKTIRAIKRAILKWKFPVGTIVTCTGRYVDDTYEFKIV